MNHVLAHRSIVPWLQARMAQHRPLPAYRVRLIGVLVLDPSLADPDTGARASWIDDGPTLSELLERCGTELSRYDVIAAVTWPVDRPVVSIVIVNQ